MICRCRCGAVIREIEMKQVSGHYLVIIACAAVITTGLYIFPVTAALCDGPPQSQAFILFSGGCNQSPPGLPCTQGFMFPAQPSAGGDFPTGYFLDFGDGSPPYYGTVDGVSHTYARPGIFTLKYMAGTECDLWRSDTLVINIPTPQNYSPVIPACEVQQPSAGFMGNPLSGVAPLTVQFASTSTGASAYMWTFGDGGTSPAQNPRHTYRTPGIYSVSLEARDACSGAVSRAGMSNFITVTKPESIITISSNPPGAAVFIDNVIKGITPLTLSDLPVGNHALLITLDGYEGYTRNISLESAPSQTISAELKKSTPQPTVQPPLNGSMIITTIPSGAAVIIDAIPGGIAPVIIPDVLPGNHVVTLSFDGYEDWNHTVPIRSGQTSEINAILVAKKEITGSLAVITNPPGAEIFIDGDFRGVSPVTISGIPAGTHTVLLSLQDYVDNTTSVSITSGQTRKYSSDLQKIHKLAVTDLLLAAGAIVMIAVIALVVMFRKYPKKR
jgi:PKD repeat protein